MCVAILGWGSLISEPRGLPIAGEWQKDGPMLWIEFSRISKRGARAGCLTLVIDERSDEEIRAFYVISARADLAQAIADLQAREGTSSDDIGFYEVASGHFAPNALNRHPKSCERISAALGVLIFIAMRWGLPVWAGNDNTRQILAKGIAPLAPLALVVFGIFAIGSFWFGNRRRRLVDEQTSLESLRNTTWKDFEFLVAEAYRRRGYQVEYSLNRGADGGVDLVLRRNGRISLVQCKQWKVFSVGAPVIREMFGLLTSERADEAIIVTSGNFTRDAQSFAEDKPIRLVDGPQLLALVQSVQTRPADIESVEAPTQAAAPACPLCGKPMVLRTARRGTNAGNQFWGCSAYPVCKGIREA